MKRQLVILAVLQALDLLTTWLGIRAGAAEQNPIGVALLGGGFHSLVLAKLAALVVVAGLAAWLVRLGLRDHARLGLIIPCCFMVAIVGWNVWCVLLRTL